MDRPHLLGEVVASVLEQEFSDLKLITHGLLRFYTGWPNRRLRMRENFPSAVRALRTVTQAIFYA
jgi:hypothetical protein